MNDAELELSAHRIILKISVIVGWTIPLSDEMVDMLTDQFSKKLSEGYSNLNEAEVEYAFRNKGIETRDWGKSLNLSLIDEVMLPYLEERFEISKTEESLTKLKMLEEEKKETTDEEMFEWIEDWKQKEVIDLEIIPLQFYEFLENKKIISVPNKIKHEFIGKAAAQIKGKLIDEMGLSKNDDAYKNFKSFEKMEVEGFEGDLKIRITNRAKRLIIKDYLIQER